MTLRTSGVHSTFVVSSERRFSSHVNWVDSKRIGRLAPIWAGLHFRTADVQAVEMGENNANFAMENYFQ
jgi:hypothetical protein